MENPMAAVRQNTDMMYGRRRKTPYEIAEENRQAASGARTDELGLRRQIAQQSSLDARAAQESQQQYGMTRDAAQNRHAERMGYIGQGITPPADETMARKPAGPNPVDVANNVRQHMRQRQEMADKLKTGWRPSVTYGGEKVFANDNGGVQATAGQMQTGALANQASQLEDVQQSNIRGMEAMKRATGALRTPVEAMNGTQLSPQQAIQGVQLDQAAGGMNRSGGEVWRDQQVNAKLMGESGDIGRLERDQALQSRLELAQQANQLIGPNQAELQGRMADRGVSSPPLGPMAVDQPQAVAQEAQLSPQIAQWREDNPMAVEAGMQPPDYMTPTAFQGQAGPTGTPQAQAQGFDNTALMDRNQQIMDRLKQQLADLQAQQAQTAQPKGGTIIPGGAADRAERSMKLKEAESRRQDQAMNTTLQAQLLAPHVTQAIANIPTNSPEAMVAGVRNALLLGGTPEEKLKIGIAIRSLPWYGTAPEATRAAIENVFNPQVGAPLPAATAQPAQPANDYRKGWGIPPLHPELINPIMGGAEQSITDAYRNLREKKGR